MQLDLRDTRIAALEAKNARLTAELAATKQDRWTCFHCGFETTDREEAAAHFGDRDDAEEFTPLCRWWKNMTPEERGEALQEAIRDLNAEREENALLRTRIEGLGYQVEGQKSEIKSFAPFRGCDSINQVFHVYDSMEGRALAAEKELADARDREAALEEALRFIRNEASASVGLEEDAIRALIGNTNMACLMSRIEEADVLLANLSQSAAAWREQVKAEGAVEALRPIPCSCRTVGTTSEDAAVITCLRCRAWSYYKAEAARLREEAGR